MPAVVKPWQHNRITRRPAVNSGGFCGDATDVISNVRFGAAVEAAAEAPTSPLRGIEDFDALPQPERRSSRKSRGEHASPFATAAQNGMQAARR